MPGPNGTIPLFLEIVAIEFNNFKCKFQIIFLKKDLGSTSGFKW